MWSAAYWILGRQALPDSRKRCIHQWSISHRGTVHDSLTLSTQCSTLLGLQPKDQLDSIAHKLAFVQARSGIDHRLSSRAEDSLRRLNGLNEEEYYDYSSQFGHQTKIMHWYQSQVSVDVRFPWASVFCSLLGRPAKLVILNFERFLRSLLSADWKIWLYNY